jgi:membrane-associated phospholipid phosphatase
MSFKSILPALLLLIAATAASAQTPDSVPPASSAPVPQRPGATAIRWWHVGVAVGGVAAISLADKEVRTWVVDHRTRGEQDVAGQWQKWGEGPVPVALTLGTLGAGLILQKPEVTRTGGRLATSLVVVTLLGRGMKKAIGRARPSEGPDQYTFDPFGTFNSFPSGHTITAFAISTVLADGIDDRWADIGLYTLAAGTGVSRMVGDHHWLSDVVGAAVLGTTVAKVVDGKWRIFGLTSPEFLTGAHGAELRWSADVPVLRR